MSYFSSLKKKIIEERNVGKISLEINQFNAEQYALFSHLEGSLSRVEFLVFPTAEQAEEYYEMRCNNQNQDKVLLLPGLDHGLYGGHVASERSLYERFSTLSTITTCNNKESLSVICSIESLASKVPSLNLMQDSNLNIEVSDIIGPFELREKLIELGYQSSTTVEEPGTFSSRGEIFDIYTMDGRAIRINYFDDMIEEIHLIDTETNKTLKDAPVEKVTLTITPKFFTNSKFVKEFMGNIPNFGPSKRMRFEKRKEIINKINDSIAFENYPLYLPLFFNQASSLMEYIKQLEANVTFFNVNTLADEWQQYVEQQHLDFSLTEADNESDCILPELDYYYDLKVIEEVEKYSYLAVNDLNVVQDLNNEKPSFDFEKQTLNQLFKDNYTPSLQKDIFLKNLFTGLAKVFGMRGHIVFLYSHETAKKQLLEYFDVFDVDQNLQNRFEFINYEITNGFYYEPGNVLFLSERDIFSNTAKKAIKQKKIDYDLFAEQLSTLKKGDYVIHTEHGVGQYQGLESIDMSGNTSDYLVLLYANNDKVYVPVYKMDLIQKHANSSANLKTDNLRTAKFSNVKKRARESAKKLAFDLLKLQAKRASTKAYAFSPPDNIYRDFELAFSYRETADQQTAIEKVLDDMQNEKPMDHLVCGDVGFGKTEVAMRAAFKAVLDNKQVAILVPTTILALQHHNTFCKRFANFPVSIEFISRLKTTKECNDIFKRVSEGSVDILIGTHKILSDKIKYKDLGLVIVDEEQRFGVNHKEKLKLLKASIDFLTLTATPLPRTLQLGFLGLKDISIIKTPPAKRQSIKTYLIKEEPLTLKSAIEKELQRGGQVFIVHNKVNDIELFSAKIRELVPKASITIAHGQMTEKELEKRIDTFYKGNAQILIATTIIESGIDIPNANTMIVDRADQFGLSQLHQLRGRIGRSDKKAYAYFVIPNDRSLNPVAEKRLKALQMYADMGSGFNIASSDLEIRGAGDIIGANQSGHIESVGLELYMNLLKEAISELKGEENVYNKNIEVKTPFPSYIPSTFIDNPSERLKQYKRLSNIKSAEDLDIVKEEYLDMYGPLPQEMLNLFLTFQIRIILGHCGINALSTVGNSINIQFDKDILDHNQDLAGRIASYFLSKPKLYKFSPDYKVLCYGDGPINMTNLVDFCHKISEEIRN